LGRPGSFFDQNRRASEKSTQEKRHQQELLVFWIKHKFLRLSDIPICIEIKAYTEE
jgi:hypothetical protein